MGVPAHIYIYIHTILGARCSPSTLLLDFFRPGKSLDQLLGFEDHVEDGLGRFRGGKDLTTENKTS